MLKTQQVCVCAQRIGVDKSIWKGMIPPYKNAYSVYIEGGMIRNHR